MREPSLIISQREFNDDPYAEPIMVYLNEADMAHCRKIGDERHQDSRQRGLLDRCDPQSAERKRDLEMEAVAAEVVVALVTNEPGGEDVGTFKKPDVGKWIQVRHTTYMNGRLIVRHGDKDGEFYVSVVGEKGTYQITGWKWGLEAKDDRWWQDPGGRGKPAYFVPRSELEPLATLQAAIVALKGTL